MAVAVQLDFPGATLEQYDECCKLMGLTPKGQGLLVQSPTSPR